MYWEFIPVLGDPTIFSALGEMNNFKQKRYKTEKRENEFTLLHMSVLTSAIVKVTEITIRVLEKFFKDIAILAYASSCVESPIWENIW